MTQLHVDGGNSGTLRVLRQIVAYVALVSACSSTLASESDDRPLSARGRDNVVAFARLVGYVRFFHPSDEAARTDWDRLTVHGMQAVEAAPNAERLVATLNELLRPVAPTVAVYRTGTAAPAGAAPPSSATLGVIYWHHFGLGAGSNPYRSTRRRVAAPDGQPPPFVRVPTPGMTGVDSIPVPDPRQPIQVDLGGGVSASVPLAVYTTREDLPDSLPAPSRPLSDSTAVPNRATRLAVASTLWSVAQHFYPYFDIVGTNWDSTLAPTLAAVATQSDPDAFDGTLERLVAALHDGHGSFYSARDQARHRWFAHPPVRLGWVEGRIVVSVVEEAAAAAGVLTGDEVLRVDGRPVADVLAEREARTSGATAGYVRSIALRQMLIGFPGSTVELSLRNPLGPDTTSHQVHLARVEGPYMPRAAPAKVSEVAPGVYYLDLGRIADADFTAVLPQLLRATGVIFDIRSYPRAVSTPAILATLSDTALHSAPFEVPVVAGPDRRFSAFLDGGWPVRPSPTRVRAPAAFLIGPDVVSYGETTMGIVEAYHLGVMVGSTTAGTNGNVNFVKLPGGYGFRFTGMRVRKHDGSPLHGVGIRPTVPVERTIRGLRDGHDEVLDRAVALLRRS